MPRRPPQFDLRAAVRSPSFTPSVADAGALVGLLGEGEEDAAVERALVHLGAPAARAALSRLPESAPPHRGRLARLVGKLAAAGVDDDLWAAVLALAADRDDKTRRNAILALGRAAPAWQAAAESLLLARWSSETGVPERRSLAASLGRVGGAEALARLDGLDTDDQELRRITDEARLRLRQRLTRGAETAAHAAAGIDGAAVARRPLAVWLHCRRGIEGILADELAPFRPSVRGPGLVELHTAGPLRELFRARTFLSFGFPLPPEPLGDGGAALAAARALTSPRAAEVFSAFTRGAVRYRLEWLGGRKRATVLRCARAVASLRPELVNDPSQRSWEVVVREEPPIASGEPSRGARKEGPGAVSLELRPRLDDPRFTYRAGDVPAASHPTLAAALAWVAGARPDDVVWDPFVGSGSELCERARQGRYRLLIGTDNDPAALDVARANLAAAGVEADLRPGDALADPPRGVTLVITNPPMGRRVLPQPDIGDFLDRFVAHAARALVPGGRFVWISPFPRRTAERAARAGLTLDLEQRVDMGGFWAALQRFIKAKKQGKENRDMLGG